MTNSRFQFVREVLQSAVDRGDIPGAVAACGRQGEVMFEFVGGAAQTQGGPYRPMTRETWFDLASLTKVTVTLPALLLLLSQGMVSLSDSVRQFFPEWNARWDDITVRMLLTHTAGLPPHRDYYQHLVGRDAFLRAIEAEPWEFRPGTAVRYSDLGFILLGALIERITQMPLGQYGEQAVFGPLGLHQATFCPPPSIQGLCAATELIDGQALVGVVHDENARALGGMAGHAGLFATLDAVSRYAALWSSSAASGLPHAAKEAALRSETGSLDGNRGLGWVLHGDAYDVAGDLWPLSGAGHTGFTGTSIQFDRVTGIWAVLLTNRVHFGRAVNIGGLRRRFHNAVAAALLG